VNIDLENQHLAQVERHIAEAKTRIGRQERVVEDAIKKGWPSPEAQSLLEVLEGSLRALEHNRALILAMIKVAKEQEHSPRQKHSAGGYSPLGPRGMAAPYRSD
jgi:hypothetical protein